MFKRSAILAALVATILTLTAPAHAGTAHLVSRHQFRAAQVGDVKRDVRATFGSRGHRTLAWSDNGAWIQQQYRGALIPDQWEGTETKAVLDYRWTPGTGWVLEFKTWCVWDNLNTWVCS